MLQVSWESKDFLEILLILEILLERFFRLLSWAFGLVHTVRGLARNFDFIELRVKPRTHQGRSRSRYRRQCGSGALLH